MKAKNIVALVLMLLLIAQAASAVSEPLTKKERQDRLDRRAADRYAERHPNLFELLENTDAKLGEVRYPFNIWNLPQGLRENWVDNWGSRNNDQPGLDNQGELGQASPKYVQCKDMYTLCK